MQTNEEQAEDENEDEQNSLSEISVKTVSFNFLYYRYI